MLYALLLALGFSQLIMFVWFKVGLIRSLSLLAGATFTLAIFMSISIDIYYNLSSINLIGFVLIVVTLAYYLLNIRKIIMMRSSLDRTKRSASRANLVIISLLMLGAFLFNSEYQESHIVEIIIALYAGILVLVALNSIISYFSYRFYSSRIEHLTDKELPSISILIPARDESQELLACLETVTAIDYPKLEILVLDDCSTNPKTSEIIKSFARKGVRFVQGDPPEDGWIGKNNAYESLRKDASSEWLFFMGSDARLNKQTLRNLMSYVSLQKLDMVSLQPFRDPTADLSVLAPLRYWWEFAIPRRFIKRPAVLSTTWLIKKAALENFGGFSSVSRSIIPERHIARSLGSKYLYKLASPKWCWVSTSKTLNDQYKTAILQRYAQIRRRMEWQLLASLFVVIGLSLIPLAYVEQPWLLLVALVSLSVSVFLPSLAHNPSTSLFRALFALPLLVQELVLMNISMYRYEFGAISWKGRNVCLPVMRVVPNLPSLPVKGKSSNQHRSRKQVRSRKRYGSAKKLDRNIQTNHRSRRHKKRNKHKHRNRHR